VKTKQQPLQDKEWATDNFGLKFNQKQIKVFLIAQFFFCFSGMNVSDSITVI